MEIQKIVTNTALIGPAISFVGGAVIGRITRVIQSEIFSKNEAMKNNWLPGGSAIAGLSFASNTSVSGAMYGICVASALVGDYLATKFVDRINKSYE